MGEVDWDAVAHELTMIHDRAEAVADTLDPNRTFTYDTSSRKGLVLRELDKIVKAASYGRTIITNTTE